MCRVGWGKRWGVKVESVQVKGKGWKGGLHLSVGRGLLGLP